MYRELRRQKNASGLLRFRKEGEGKNNEYEPKLLQGLGTLPKVNLIREYSSIDGMKGKALGRLIFEMSILLSSGTKTNKKCNKPTATQPFSSF
jgi:hypothetical protein